MKNTSRIIVGLCVIAIITAAGWVWNSSRHQSEQGAVVVGVIAPLSGQYAAYGEGMVKGAELAAKEYNASHPSRAVQLIVEDDAFDAKKGLSAYKKLVDVDHVSGLIVGTSATINVIYPDVKDRSIPVITYGAQSEDEQDDNVFHIYPSSVPVIKGLADYVKAQNQSSKVSAIITNDVVTQKFLATFRSELGSQTLDVHLIAPNADDVRSEVTKTLAAQPDYIFMSNLVDVGVKTAQEIIRLRGSRSNTPVMVFDLTFNEAFSTYQKALGDTRALDGSIVAVVRNAASPDFAQKYKSEYGKEQEPLADYGYDAVSLLIQSYDRNDKTWIRNISKTNYSGATGAFTFDNVGRRIPDFKIMRITDGKIPAYQ